MVKIKIDFYTQTNFNFVVAFNAVKPNNLAYNLTCHLWPMWLLGSLKNLAYTEDAIVSVSYYYSVLIRTGGTHKQLGEVMKCYLAPYIMM